MEMKFVSTRNDVLYVWNAAEVKFANIRSFVHTVSTAMEVRFAITSNIVHAAKSVHRIPMHYVTIAMDVVSTRNLDSVRIVVPEHQDCVQ